jgi:hypothetical protein
MYIHRKLARLSDPLREVPTAVQWTTRVVLEQLRMAKVGSAAATTLDRVSILVCRSS